MKKDEKGYHFKKIEVNTKPAQDGLQPLLKPKQIDTKAQFMTKGVFDILSTAGGGHDH